MTLILATWGLCVTGTHTYHYLADLEFRKIQPVGIFLMPLGQWFAVACLGLAVKLRALRNSSYLAIFLIPLAGPVKADEDSQIEDQIRELIPAATTIDRQI